MRDRYFTRPNEQKAARSLLSRSQLRAALGRERQAVAARCRGRAYLQNVDADGLEPSDYPVPDFKSGDLDALAEAELRMTGEVLEYARHASTGRVHYSRVSNDIGYELDAPEPPKCSPASPARPT